ncbi:hypothetical protein BCV69DRAFT_283467 [Microstroma glucosiphilum]|uniref:CRCB-domain-containing protein n=1 Tax=Pseudomicrostroma glucosiphilum TaxID=1684307 RepID=A0A316U529_9BASI|nr:hypothetical protein BCV69DRAFT_283467 [Pseudomicrostroma glucosiphilum]PWN19938.1 hypothetical protein BCV69DRAFT_283467 [Pseudomicrostroma glucosiphilum]
MSHSQAASPLAVSPLHHQNRDSSQGVWSSGKGAPQENVSASSSGSRRPREQIRAEDVPQDDSFPSPAASYQGSSNRVQREGTPTEVGRQIEPFSAEEETAEETDKASNGEGDPPVSRLHATLRHCAILGLLAFASIWGTLTREGLIALNTYDGQSIKPVIWAQAVGCLVMGWTVANKEALDRLYPPVFVMLGTGYCGSVTTFSTWILNVFQAYGDQSHYNRHGLHNVMDALTQTFATLGISIAALTAGKHLARVLPATAVVDFIESAASKRRRRKSRRSLSSSHTQAVNGDSHRAQEHKTTSTYPPSGHKTHLIPSSTRSNPPLTPIVDVFCFLVLGIGFWIGAVLLAALPPQADFRPLTFALVFSPPGAILRWYLSPLNSAKGSKRFPYWPLGTFSANILAVFIICALFVGQHYGPTGTRLAASTTVSCQVLYGLQEGFCGCLSTISTFAVELRNLKPKRRAVGYAVGSYVIGIAICVLLIGAPWWSQGMDGSCEGLLSYPK